MDIFCHHQMNVKDKLGSSALLQPHPCPPNTTEKPLNIKYHQNITKKVTDILKSTRACRI